MADDSHDMVEVLLPLALEGPLSYLAPRSLGLVPGDYVAAPLGPREMIGVVWECRPLTPTNMKLREVIGKFDMVPMAELNRRFVDWVSAYYLEPAGNVLRMCLRAPAALEGERQQIAYVVTGDEPQRMTPQRRRALDAAKDAPALRASELSELSGVGLSVVKGLIGEGALKPVALPAMRAFAEPQPLGPQLKLSAEQQIAARELRALVAQRGVGVALLDGVTGSGKTEVYFEAMAAALAGGSQVLLLVPEIALTQQFLSRVEERFQAEPAAWHSELRPRERERVWRGVGEGRARIVVGARSALFLPWRKLGLIVVDEEHEGAYKQEDGVPYHARDMAIVHGSLGKFPVILSSATPSLETLVNVDRGRYRHVTLKDRHGRPELPRIDLIDMRQTKLGASNWISPALDEAVRGALDAGEQALLFLNRRGFAPLTLCRTCGFRIECPNCAAALVEHRFRRQMQCHHCGFTQPMPQACPSCGAAETLVSCGPGIERLADEAASRYPDARIVVLSSDLSRGTLLRDALRDVAKGEYNLIIGTQLVAKGHHFPQLTLAGVVDADLALESGDPRAGERTWQLMAQVAGRAGRGEKPGRALIQTYLPDHPLMQSLKRGDRDGFLGQEKRIRQEAGLPPYGRLVAIIVSGNDAGETEQFSRWLAKRVVEAKDIRVLGPAPAPIALVRGRYRWRFLIKAGRETNVQAFIREWLHGVKSRGSLKIDIDVDPYSFL